VFDWIGTGILTILGFAFLLIAIVGKFKFFGIIETYKKEEGGIPMWDRLISGALGTIFISFEAYRVVKELEPCSSLLPKATAAATTAALFLYLFALWLHDWNEDKEKKEKPVRKWIRIVLLVMLAIPLIDTLLSVLQCGDLYRFCVSSRTSFNCPASSRPLYASVLPLHPVQPQRQGFHRWVVHHFPLTFLLLSHLFLVVANSDDSFHMGLLVTLAPLGIA